MKRITNLWKFLKFFHLLILKIKIEIEIKIKLKFIRKKNNINQNEEEKSKYSISLSMILQNTKTIDEYNSIINFLIDKIRNYYILRKKTSFYIVSKL